jgi:dTDP-4-dehydrorhamnose 3,5-epimerase
MKFLSTAIPDVVIVEPQVFGDSRGFFMETWQKRKFAEGGIDVDFVQDNHSASAQWILRGLHYQLDKPQGKLVRVTQGAVYDVAVDLRKSSPTFGRWVGVELSADNKRMLWVPPGFAHGFLSLSERVEFLYKCTEYYVPAAERAIAWNDRTLDIAWPLPANVTPTLSAKDAKGVSFDAAEKYS